MKQQGAPRFEISGATFSSQASESPMHATSCTRLPREEELMLIEPEDLALKARRSASRVASTSAAAAQVADFVGTLSFQPSRRESLPLSARHPVL